MFFDRSVLFFRVSRPYPDQSRIKDLRTGVERSDTQKVLDGDLDEFIEASLKSGLDAGAKRIDA